MLGYPVPSPKHLQFRIRNSIVSLLKLSCVYSELGRTQPFQIAFGHSVTSLRCIIRITTRSRSRQTSRELSLERNSTAPRLGNSRYLISTRFTECYCYACEQSDHARYISQPEIGFPLFVTTPVSFFPGRRLPFIWPNCFPVLLHFSLWPTFQSKSWRLKAFLYV